MDLLHQLIDVQLSLGAPQQRVHRHADAPGAMGPDAVLIPRQPLQGKLRIAFENANGEKDATARALLSQVGESDLATAWAHLLERLVLVPFFLDPADKDDASAGAETASRPSTPRGSAPPATAGALEDDELTAARATPVSGSAATPPPPRPSTVGSGCEPATSVFQPGVPSFWNDRLFAKCDEQEEEDDDGDDDEEDEGEGGDDRRERNAGVPAGGAERAAGGRTVDASAARARTDSRDASAMRSSYSGAGDTDSQSEAGVGRAAPARRLPCRTAGKLIEVNSAGRHTVVVPKHSSSSSVSIPASIRSEYSFEFTVPEVHKLYFNVSALLTFVVLMSPLADASAAEVDAENGRGDDDADSNESADKTAGASLTVASTEWSWDQRLTTMRVLSRAFVNPFDAGSGRNGIATFYGLHTILLGSLYTPVIVRRALVCQSVTYPLSNDRLLLNLNITNVSRSSVVLHSASLDIYSTTTTTPRAGSGGRSSNTAWRHLPELWAEQRAGPVGANMRTIDVLTKLLTVTPMIVSDDRPPFTLHAEETYSFQFILEVVPQLCYLLNPKSLQHVYAKYTLKGGAADGAGVAYGRSPVSAMSDGGARGGRGDMDSEVGRQDSGGGAVVRQSTGNAETVITDCYGDPVSTEEVISVLSSTYLSYLFVYFDLLREPDGDAGEAAISHPQDSPSPHVVKADGLHLRHAAQWSFGAT